MIQAGQLLAEQVLLLAKKTNQNAFELGLNGSIIEKNQFVQQSFYQSLEAQQLDVKICQTQALNAKAVLYYFRERNSE